MDELYARIDTANRFTPQPANTVPIKDQSSQAAFGLDWAARQGTRETPPEPQRMPPIVPVAS